MLAAQNRIAARPARTFRASPRSAAASRVVVRAGAVSEIVDKLKTLTLLEAAELVKEIESTFGVDASAAAAPVMMAAAPGGGAAAAAPVAEEKTAFDVILEEIPADKKVGIYKVVRNIAGIAVNQVKEFTASLPKAVKEGASKDEAIEAVKQLTDAGAKAKWA